MCASIEVKQHPPVWRLTNNHLSTAQENPGNLQGTVIYTMYKCSPLTKKLRIYTFILRNVISKIKLVFLGFHILMEIMKDRYQYNCFSVI